MKPKSTLPLLLLGSWLLAISYSHAANIWDGGGGDGNWNTIANWDNNALPGTGALTFTGDVQTSTNNNLVAVDPTFGGINFTNDGSAGKTNAFTLTGSRVTLGGNITTTANTAGSTITDVISLNMILNNNRTVTTNQLSSSVQHNLTISGVVSQDASPRSLTKVGLGTLTFNGSTGSTFTGGLVINGGTVVLDYANMATATNLIASNVVTLRGSNLLLKGKSSGATAQTLGNVTISVGGNSLLIDPNGGTSTTLNLGTLDSTTQGASLLVGKALGAGSGTVTITTTTNKNAQGIYRPRIVFADGTSTGYDWATTASVGSPYTLAAYSAYSALNTAAGTDTLNSRITASATLGGSRTTNTLKIENPAASQSLDLAGNTLTLTGGLLATGTNAFQITGSAGSKLIGQNGSGAHDLIVHQFNSGGLTIGVEIANNGANATALTKAGTGSLTLSGSNTFTGGLFINSGEVRLGNAGALNSSVGSENNVTMSNSTILSLNGNNVVVKSLASVNATDLNGDAIVRNANANAATLTVGNATSGNTTFTGIIQDGGGGALSLIKTGTGIQTLSGTPTSVNTYTGGTTISGGILELRSTVANADVDGLLGAASGGITLSGGGELRATSTNVFAARIVTIGTGGGSLRVNKNNAFTTSGKLTGSSPLTLLDPGGTGAPSIYNFNSTSNDFTGGIVANNAILGVASLADSANNIVFNSTLSANFNASPGLRYGSTAVTPLSLSSRAIEFNSAVTSNVGIQNNNTTHAINIGSNLVATGAGAKTLYLDAAAGPTNVFSGNITDGTGGGTMAVTRPTAGGALGAGTWTLSGNNSYSGATTIDTGTLAGIGANAFGSTSGIRIAAAGTLSLRGDSSTTFASSNVTASASNATINVDQATIAGTGAKTMTMGTLGTTSTAATYQVNFTGANNTSLGLGAVTGTASTAAATVTLANNIAAGGNLTLASYTSANTTGGETVFFSGTGNTTVTGAVTPGAATLNLRQNGSGILTLNGSSTYTGITTISSGVVEAATLDIGGNNSSIGKSSNDAANLVFGTSTATLRYTGGSNVITDRGFSTSTGAGGGATIESSGAGTLSFNNTVAINYGTTNQTRTLTLGGTNTGANTFGKVIGNNGTGATSLSKTGVGTWALSADNSYTGATNVNAGTLAISGTGDINSTSAINVTAGATFAYNSSTALTVAPTLNGTGTGAGQRAVLGGTGPINTAITLNNLGDTLSPGNSPGIMSFETGQTWASFGYDWELNDWAASVAGTNIDQIGITGSLTLSGAVSGSYLLNILSLTGSNVAGNVPNFAESSKSWTILTTTSGISGFDASYWNLVTSGFSSSPTATGTWSLGLANGDNDLVLTYAPIPEPRAALLGALGLLILLRRRR